MITVRRGNERGHADHGWLDTYHTFSFGDYYDPQHMGFRSLRVINEDRVAPGGGFPTHPHRDMEIITYVLEGALEHKDSMGTTAVIRPGEVQKMTAGAGVTHSEFNHSKTEPVHLLQIWILPAKKGLKPGYEQVALDAGRGSLQKIPITIHQDVVLYCARLDAGVRVNHALGTQRSAWLQVARGAVTLNGESLQAGDGAAISDEPSVTISANSGSEILLFDLA